MANETPMQRSLVLLMRLCIGWTFLYAGLTQVADPAFSAGGFLNTAKTFPGFFQAVASPGFLPVVDAIIPWAHLLIGLAVVTGLLFRLAAIGATALFILYYLPRLDFPMAGPHEFIVEYHLVYALVTVYLITIGAGRVFGLDGWLEGNARVKAYQDRFSILRLAMG